MEVGLNKESLINLKPDRPVTHLSGTESAVPKWPGPNR